VTSAVIPDSENVEGIGVVGPPARGLASSSRHARRGIARSRRAVKDELCVPCWRR
jgi:hypothetical protein